MKGHLLALLTACSLAVSLVIASPVITFAAEDDIEKAGGIGDDGEVYVRDDSGVAQPNGTIVEKDFDVQAKVLGSSDKIVYSIHIEYGDMEFAYDFGQTWDPVNHVYSTAASGESTGGWVKSYIDGTNNSIYVRNDSNYPIKAEFSYSTPISGTASIFNSNYRTGGAVIGIFSNDNATLKSNVNSTAYNGYGSATAAGMTSYSVDLDMDYSHLSNTDADFGVLGTNTYEGTVYFTLCGKPDSNTTLTSDFISVGTIKLKITPIKKSLTGSRPTI